MNDLLTVCGLNKTFDRFALRDVSFTLPEGCITGFIGANGAGKTTTLRTIFDLIHKDSGEVQCFGMDMDTDARAIKDRIGVVLDGGGFYDELSLVEMKRIIAPAYSHWSEDDFRSWLEYFRLDPHQKIDTLSRGMRMKFALSLALSHNADLLIMDEPTSGLDPKIRRQLLRTLSTFMENGGKGVFFSTHITSDLDKIADYLIMIDDDRIVKKLDLKPEDIEHKKVRFRTLGCYPLTGAVESDADTLDAIVEETLGAVESERTSRVIDHEGAGSMERRKREGYF